MPTTTHSAIAQRGIEERLAAVPLRRDEIRLPETVDDERE
jgi:hypothetical protein